MYPEGWRHRKFFGGRKITDQKKKQPRLDDPRIKAAEQELEREKNALKERQEDERRIYTPGVDETKLNEVKEVTSADNSDMVESPPKTSLSTSSS